MSTLPELPMLKPWYRTARLGDTTLFHYGRSLVALSGLKSPDLLGHLVALLDGNRSIAEIANSFAQEERQVIMMALNLMNARELLLDGTVEVTRTNGTCQTACFFGAALGLPIHPNRIARSLEGAILGVVGSSVTAVTVQDTLRQAGCVSWTRRSTDQLPRALAGTRLLIAAPVAEEVGMLSVINRACLESKTPWMQVLPFDGDVAVVGPIFVPLQSCCHECFRLRRNANSQLGQRAEFLDQIPPRWAPSTIPLEYMLAGLTSMSVLRWLVSPSLEPPGRAMTVESGQRLFIETHAVYRVPRCPECSGRFAASSSSRRTSRSTIPNTALAAMSQ